MKLWRTIGVLSLSSVLLMSGCFLKKKKPPVPPQAQAPTVESTPPPATAPVPQPQVQPSTTATPPPGTVPPKETAKKPKHKKPAAKKAEPEVAKTTPPPAVQPHSKVVIREGGTADSTPQLSASMHGREAMSHENQTTAQLIDSAEANLRSLNRTLSSSEQEMVTQIRSYIQQAKQATTDGDALRAHNLALKAHLLSDHLVSP